MFDDFMRLHEYFINKTIKIPNKMLNEVVQNYLFLNISENNEINQESQVFQKIKESKVMIINYFKESNKDHCDSYFILGFKNTILIITNKSISLIKHLFTLNSELEIYFLKNAKDAFDEKIRIQYKEAKTNPFFEDEINNFGQFLSIRTNLKSIKKIWDLIIPNISGYLIEESYYKLKCDRFKKFDKNSNEKINENVENERYIELRCIGTSTTNFIKLAYFIEEKEFYVIKKIRSMDIICSRLLKRETNNYLNIKHPFIPRFYGTTKNDKYLIIEYIEGQNLENIKKLHLNKTDKYSIILQLITVIQYLHNQKFIYRDLKPNNVMIDQDKNAILIDFDQMIRYNNEVEQTRDFNSIYIAPEINDKNLHESADIFSIGQMIYFIMNEKHPSGDMSSNLKDFDLHPEIKIFYLKCTKENPDERPSIIALIVNFYNFIISKNINLYHIYPDVQLELAKFSYNRGNYQKAIFYNSLAAEKNQSEALYNLGMFYLDGTYIKQDINKAIHYFTLASELNYLKAQINLGAIYYDEKYVQRDINKSIHYYSLASDNNDPRAQYNLGIFYYTGEYIKQDINKAIHYFTLASNQNFSDASFFLGEIYYDKKYIPQDINKAIHYFTLASNQNNNYKAQFYLGLIYINENDINKAIHYFTLSANQNNTESQINLGKIYYEKKYIERDINKGIYYFSLAANNNNVDAQLYLGEIFIDGKYIQRDVNKSIHYFTLASNQNSKIANFYLGLIYYDNKYIQRDISKSIKYFTLAANNDNSDAFFYLGKIYLEEKYFDINKAIYCLQQASNQSNVDAQLMVGVIYYEGKYIQRDINKSIHYFQLASNQNSKEANFNLGLIYHNNKYINCDINKAIHYYSLAAEQNYPDALNNLGIIYAEGQYVTRDINKALYYFQKASDYNYSKAQFNLGSIYYEGKYVKKDFKKAMHYYTLSSNQNDFQSQFDLGMIYLKGKFVKQDIKKAINYLVLSSNQNHPIAQLNLGVIYYEGKYVKRDINKAIHYSTLAAKQNQRNAQYNLGLIYYEGTLIKQDIQKSLFWFMQSSDNGFADSSFAIGYFYHEGKYIKQDINKSIHFYKEASSFNNQYAKNNLGILYKNGFGDEVQKNVKVSKIYFKEAIKFKEDVVSMYNLSHIYIYEKSSDKSINKAINLLVKSIIKHDFKPSKILLCLTLVKKYNFDSEKIKSELSNFKGISKELINDIIDTIKQMQLYLLTDFEIDYLYNPLFIHFPSSNLSDHKKVKKIENKFNINSHFYEGFGIEV